MRLLLQAILDQSIGAAKLEVILADGGSTDGTLTVVRAFADQHPSLSVRIVENPARVIPAALNRAIAAANGEVIVRLDAHSIPQPDYVAQCLRVLRETEAANAGGVWEIHPSAGTWIARSIAAAASHRLGAGDARYRTSGAAGEVDTVPLGAYPRIWLDRVGPYDESLLTNEDYEYNVRLRQAGGRIWFDPSIRSIYFARATLGDLARQYARYGFWKARMLRRYPGTLRLRQALPPAFVLAAFGLALAVPWVPLARWLLGLQWALYVGTLLTAGVAQARLGHDAALAVGMPLAWAVMHLAWGGAFWWGWLTLFGRGRSESIGS
ncbi:MAG: glycosyltransferase family 2 protein [Chloroflexi bacterium]|nr:glycosyltransferase family 2 protein [Chloroflexota bacterium]